MASELLQACLPPTDSGLDPVNGSSDSFALSFRLLSKVSESLPLKALFSLFNEFLCYPLSVFAPPEAHPDFVYGIYTKSDYGRGMLRFYRATGSFLRQSSSVCCTEDVWKSFPASHFLWLPLIWVDMNKPSALPLFRPPSFSPASSLLQPPASVESILSRCKDLSPAELGQVASSLLASSSNPTPPLTPPALS